MISAGTFQPSSPPPNWCPAWRSCPRARPRPGRPATTTCAPNWPVTYPAGTRPRCPAGRPCGCARRTATAPRSRRPRWSHRVVILPGSGLDASGQSQDYLRLHFVTRADDLTEAVKRLADAWRAYRPPPSPAISPPLCPSDGAAMTATTRPQRLSSRTSARQNKAACQQKAAIPASTRQSGRARRTRIRYRISDVDPPEGTDLGDQVSGM
jgi:hypothetical protein